MDWSLNVNFVYKWLAVEGQIVFSDANILLAGVLPGSLPYPSLSAIRRNLTLASHSQFLLVVYMRQICERLRCFRYLNYLGEENVNGKTRMQMQYEVAPSLISKTFSVETFLDRFEAKKRTRWSKEGGIMQPCTVNNGQITSSWRLADAFPRNVLETGKHLSCFFRISASVTTVHSARNRATSLRCR